MTKRDAIRSMKLFLFELDGTLLLGDKLDPLAIPMLRRIRQTGRRYLMMTNNSSMGVEDHIRKLKSLGILAAREELLTSGQAAAHYLRQHHPGKRLYVCGTVSLKRELEEAGLQVTEDADAAQCIIMGFDTELTFRKLRDVCRLLSTRDIPYLAANPDRLCPTEFGSVPNCGSVCDMVHAATGKRPIVIGKPGVLMPRLAMDRLGISPDRTCCVGSRLDTDIRCGLDAGITTMLVLGCETAQEILGTSDIRPHFVLEDLGEILDALQ